MNFIKTYYVLVCIAAIYKGSSIGTTFPTVNSFSAGVASNDVGISFTEGMGFRLTGLIITSTITLNYILRYAKKLRQIPIIIAFYADSARKFSLRNLLKVRQT